MEETKRTERAGKDAGDAKDVKDIKNVRDLRSALELLRTIPGELVETDVEVDPQAELSGVYRHVRNRDASHKGERPGHAVS